MPDDGNVVVKSVTITIDQAGVLHYNIAGCAWPEAIQLLEMTKLYVFADNTKADGKG